MPTQVYECETDGEFDLRLNFQDDIPQSQKCPDCGRKSKHILKVPAGGVKFARTWNESANEYQRTPYTQAKAQAENMYNEQKDNGIIVAKPTERGIQLAAAEIEKRETSDKRN